MMNLQLFGATGFDRLALKDASAVVSVSTADAGSVTSANAPAISATYVQAEVQAIATLANELKADYNGAVTLANANKTKINELITALKTAGVIK